MGTEGIEPRRIWWARPGKLCGLERPGGGGRSHRPERRAAEIAYLKAKGVRLCVSTMASRHNLGAYEAAGLGWHHVPVESAKRGAEALEELLPLLNRELRRAGAGGGARGRPTPIEGGGCGAPRPPPQPPTLKTVTGSPIASARGRIVIRAAR